jgi:hypothetical protein
MKPLPAAPLTIEDGRIWAWVLVRFLPGIGLGIVSQASDRRDAELILGLTGSPIGARDICVAELFAMGCVICSADAHTRIAIRGYEGQRDDPRDNITYFA